MSHIKPTIKKLENSRVEITAAVPAADFDTFKTKALEKIAKIIKIDGFRPGHTPVNVVEKHAGDAAVLDEMAQIAIMQAYPEILLSEKIDAIGRPEINITKLAFGNDLEFTITTAVLPTVTLSDYKDIAKKNNAQEISVTVEDAEIDAALLELRQMRAHNQMHEEGVEHHDHDHTKIDAKDLPELTDDFVKTLGKFEGIEDFKTKLRENLTKEKTERELEKKRVTLIDALIEGSTIELPDILIDFELDKMMQQFTYDISMMGMEMGEYLKRIEKTQDQLRTEWRDNAVKRAKMQLILDTLADKEKLAPDAETLETEIKKIMDMYEGQADLSEDRARAYVTQVLTNAKVFEFLEGIK
jgi:FKBP-type peptidyl-prolyl cis-trans isomerase (trigger factor)